MITVVLLLISNVFMILAWYGQLKFPHLPMIAAILIGWGIALVEYSFAVPANRIGYAHGFSGGQLKIIQEVITLLVFAGFSMWYLGQPLRWNHWAGFALIAIAGWLIFLE